MAEKRKEPESFTVTDRRLFTSEGELRTEASQETETRTPGPQPAPQPAAKQASPAPVSEMPASDKADGNGERDMPLPPTAAEQDAQAAAYRQSSKDLDSQVELSGRSAKEFEMTLERFLASLYMTAMLQLGL